MDKNFYNEASAKKLGWEPSWFGEKYFFIFQVSSYDNRIRFTYIKTTKELK